MKNKKYLLTGIITTVILCIIFFIKDIFPFGNNSIIWSDMHEQITALYYHFYDAVRGSKSILVDFTSGGGVNFVGIMAYYILSPFSLILLLFPRELVENAVSIVVMLKIVLSSITCLYFISKYFKKVNTSYQIFLSLLYAFSSYTLSLYIITPWMDLVYLFPILLIGLRKLLDLEDTKTYIIVLTLCLIFSFYVSFMVLIFIIFASLIYLYVYKKENIKKSISRLGVSTVISILISSIVLVPTFLQIGSSQRAGFDLDVILNSRLGPLSDKVSFLFMSGILIASILLLLLNYKKHKKFISFLLPLLILVGLPIIIEPINKMWHFGSYVYFPYRYGFILIFLLIIGASYYLNEVSDNNIKNKLGKYLPVLSLLITIFSMIAIYIKFDTVILEAIENLTLTRDKRALISLFLIFALVVVTTFITFFINKKNNKFTITYIGILTISTVFFNLYFYIGGYDPEGKLSLQYDQMLELSDLKDITGNYYVKEINRDLISNYGMVTGLNTYSNFTSLTDKTNYITMQKLGYDSYWMDTQSIGGNLFTDYILAQKYIISNSEYNNEYYNYKDNKLGINLYEFKEEMPYGYIIKDNVSLEDISNSFEASNLIYQSIVGNGNIFDTYQLFTSGKEDIALYKKDLILEDKIYIEGNKTLYLEIFTGFDNALRVNNYGAFDVYVNGKLLLNKFPNDERNGSISLGTFNDELVDIKIVSLIDTELKSIAVGALDLETFNEFINREKQDTSVEINDNNIRVKTTGKKGDILFLPITYLEGYSSNHEIFRVYDNFLGIRLNEGENNIEIKYIPKGLILGAVLTLIGILLYFVWTKYLCNIEMLWFDSVCYYVYLAMYGTLILVFYVIMFIFFIKSFIF